VEHRNYTAQLDQGKAGAADVARLMAAFWQALVDEGVPEEGASEITAAYTQARIAGKQKRSEA
jgi:hypothetical protein